MAQRLPVVCRLQRMLRVVYMTVNHADCSSGHRVKGQVKNSLQIMSVWPVTRRSLTCFDVCGSYFKH